MMGYRAARLWSRQLAAVEAMETMIDVKPKPPKPKKQVKPPKKECVKGREFFSLPLL